MLKKIVELCYRLVLIYFSHFPFQFAILFLSARGLALVALLQFLVRIANVPQNAMATFEI